MCRVHASLIVLSLLLPAASARADVIVEMTQGWDLSIKTDLSNANYIENGNDITISMRNGRILVEGADGVLVNGRRTGLFDLPADDLLVENLGNVAIHDVDLWGLADDIDITAYGVSMWNCRAGKMDHSNIVLEGSAIVTNSHASGDIVVLTGYQSVGAMLHTCSAGRDITVQMSRATLTDCNAGRDISLTTSVNRAVDYELTGCGCLQNLTIQGSQRVDGSNYKVGRSTGNDTIALDDIYVQRNIRIDTYSGGDTVTLNAIEMGNVTAKLGDHDDLLIATVLPANALLIFDGGAGGKDKLIRDENFTADILSFESIELR